jgi:hypothetical protein
MKEFIKQLTAAKGTGLIVNVILLVLVVFIAYSIIQRVSSSEVPEPGLNTNAREPATSNSSIPPFFTLNNNKRHNIMEYQVISSKNLFSPYRTAPESEEPIVEDTVTTAPEQAPDLNLVGVLVSTTYKRAYIREEGKDNAYSPTDEIGETGFVLRDVFQDKITIIFKDGDPEKEYEVIMQRYAGSGGASSKKMYVKGDYDMSKIEFKNINGEFRPLIYMNIRGKKYPRYLETVESPIHYEEMDGKMVPFTKMTINNKDIKVRVTEVPSSTYSKFTQGAGGTNTGSSSQHSRRRRDGTEYTPSSPNSPAPGMPHQGFSGSQGSSQQVSGRK